MIKLLVLTLLFFASETNAQQVYNKLNVKELDVTSRVNVTSTTKSSKPCPAMTETQRNAIVSPLNGSCVYNTTSLKLNVYNGTVWKAAGGGVDNWLTATAYSVDDIVIESAKIYQCLIAHTSGTFATDLAASRWVEISTTVAVNLTGPITSVGNATSIASQTGTGTKFVVDNTPTLITPNIGAATGTSLTITDKLVGAYQTPSSLLNNGDVELTDITPFTCTVGTCTRTTTSGEFSQGTAALKVALSAQAMNVSQTVTTPSGIQKQGFARVIYRVPSTMADFQVCTLVDAAEQTCVPTANLVKDDTFRSIEIPLTFGTTSAGIKFKTTSSYTANAYFDGMILSQGLGLQNLQTDNTYSATVVTTSGVVSNESVDWISSCTAANPAICTFKTGIFTIKPNCTMSADNTSAGSADANWTAATSNATQVSIYSTNGSGSALASTTVNISCQKSGNDYLASSANVYSQASANYGWTAYTPTITALNTISALNCLHSRDGQDLLLNCSFTVGSAGSASEARLSLPLGLMIADSTIVPITRQYGSGIKNTGSASTNAKNVGVLATAGQTYVKFSTLDTTNNSDPIAPSNGDVFLNSGGIAFQARVPISGWSNSSTIVGSFEDMIPKIAYLSDVKTSGTDAGSSSAATTHTRTLNTLVDTRSVVTSLSANQFTLPAGTYNIEASTPARATNRHKARIRNITDGTTSLIGTSEYALSSGAESRSLVSGEITITSAKTFELQQYTELAVGTSGLGLNVSSGESEVYSIVKIQRIK